MPPKGDRMETMMKRKKKKLYIHIFLRSMIFLLLLITAGLISYYTVMLYWQPKEKRTKTAYQDNAYDKKATAIDSDKLSKNLIISYNKKDNQIEGMVLEVLNGEKQEMIYLTLPLKTQIAMSSQLYQKMVLAKPEMPQIMKVSTLSEYIDFNDSAEDAVIIIGGMLDVEINYYTVIPSETFDEMFLEKSVSQSDGNDPVSKYAFKWSYQKTISKLKSQDDIKEYIKENYSSIQSNLSLKEKQGLSKYFEKIKTSKIRYEVIKGIHKNSGYFIDEDTIREQLKELAIH